MLALLVPLASPWTGAWHFDLPVLSSGERVEDGWVAWKFHAADADVGADVNACNSRWYHHVETRLYDAAGTLLQRRWADGPAGRGGVSLAIDGTTLVDQQGMPRAGKYCQSPGGVGGRLNGTYYAVVIAAGDMTGWTFALRGGSAVTLLNTTEDAAFFHASRDFGGTANAQAWSGPGLGGVVGGHVPMTVQGTLMGAFDGLGFHLTVETPAGSRTCPCDFDDGGLLDLDGGSAWGPGDYVFRATGAGGGEPDFDVRLVGADVRFPE